VSDGHGMSAVLEQIGILGVGEPLVRTPLRGGFHNDVSLARTSVGAFVLKHFVAQSVNPLFPQLPRAEFAALRALRSTGMAPDPVALVEDVGGRDLLVYRFVEGAPWVAGVESVAAVLAVVHRVAVDGPEATSLRDLATAPAVVASHAAPMLSADDRALVHSSPRPSARRRCPSRSGGRSCAPTAGRGTSSSRVA